MPKKILICVRNGSMQCLNAYMSTYYPPQKNNFWGGQQNQVCASVRLGRYLTNHLTFMSETLPYLCAMCSPKFRTILIKYGQLGAIFTSKWRKLSPSGPISNKPFNISVLKHYTSICYLCAMHSAKFRKIRVQNTRLRALFTKL